MKRPSITPFLKTDGVWRNKRLSDSSTARQSSNHVAIAVSVKSSRRIFSTLLHTSAAEFIKFILSEYSGHLGGREEHSTGFKSRPPKVFYQKNAKEARIFLTFRSFKSRKICLLGAPVQLLHLQSAIVGMEAEARELAHGSAIERKGMRM